MSNLDYLKSEHHEFLDAAAEAMADDRLQGILGQLNDSFSQRNRDAWNAFPGSDQAYLKR